MELKAHLPKQSSICVESYQDYDQESMSEVFLLWIATEWGLRMIPHAWSVNVWCGLVHDVDEVVDRGGLLWTQILLRGDLGQELVSCWRMTVSFTRGVATYVSRSSQFKCQTG